MVKVNKRLMPLQNKPPFIVIKQKKKPTISSVARSVKKINRKVELKNKDTLYTSGAVSAAGELTLLNNIDQGTTDLTRVGDDIYGTSIQFRSLISGIGTVLDSVIVRHIIFWDAQCNSAVPSVSTLLDTSVITTAIYAPYNQDYQKRYKILYDKTFTLTPQTLLNFVPATGTSSTVNKVAKFSRKKVKLGRQIKYNGTGSGISNLITNSLYSVWMTNSGTNLSCTTGYRFYFKDA